jgi:hypothetical protein
LKAVKACGRAFSEGLKNARWCEQHFLGEDMRLASRKLNVSKTAKTTLAAAAAAVASGIYAQNAKAVTLTQYYYDVEVYSNAGLTDVVSSVVINQATPVVNLPLGDYLSFGISDVLTNNINPAAGNTAGKSKATVAQPTHIGLYSIGYHVLSSDVQGSTLNTNPGGVRGTLNNTQTAYYSTAQIGVTTIYGVTDPGDVETDPTGAEAGPKTGGDVGMNFQIFAGGNVITSYNFGNTTGQATLVGFAPTDGSNTASAALATPIFTGLSYQGIKNGTVTLTPVVSQLAYFVVATTGTGTNSTTYNSQDFGSSDTIVSLPVLVVNIGTTGSSTPPAHPIISLSSSGVQSNYGVQITNGSSVNQGTFSTGTNVLTVSGSNGKYAVVQVQNIDAEPTDTVEANGFNPASDIEIYGLDVTTTSSGATQLSAGNLATLAADINSTNAYGYGSAIASTSLTNDPFPAKYNLFLTFTGLTSGTEFLGFDLTQDPNIPTGAAVSAVAVVPEPMSLGLLALGGVGLLARRRKSS